MIYFCFSYEPYIIRFEIIVIHCRMFSWTRFVRCTLSANLTFDCPHYVQYIVDCRLRDALRHQQDISIELWMLLRLWIFDWVSVLNVIVHICWFVDCKSKSSALTIKKMIVEKLYVYITLSFGRDICTKNF